MRPGEPVHFQVLFVTIHLEMESQGWKVNRVLHELCRQLRNKEGRNEFKLNAVKINSHIKALKSSCGLMIKLAWGLVRYCGICLTINYLICRILASLIHVFGLNLV